MALPSIPHHISRLLLLSLSGPPRSQVLAAMAPQVPSVLPLHPPPPTTIFPSSLLATPDSLARDRALALWREHIFPLPSLLTPPSYLLSPPEDDFDFALHYHLYGIWSNTLVAKWDWEQRKGRGFRWVGSVVSRQEVESVLRKVVLRRQGLDMGVRVWWWIKDAVLRGGQNGVNGQEGSQGQGRGSGNGRNRENGENGAVPSTRPPGDDKRPKRGRPRKQRENDGWGKVKIRKLGQGDVKEEQGEMEEQAAGSQEQSQVEQAAPATAQPAPTMPMMLFMRGANEEDSEAEAGQRQDGSGEDQEMEG